MTLIKVIQILMGSQQRGPTTAQVSCPAVTHNHAGGTKCMQTA